MVFCSVSSGFVTACCIFGASSNASSVNTMVSPRATSGGRQQYFVQLLLPMHQHEIAERFDPSGSIADTTTSCWCSSESSAR